MRDQNLAVAADRPESEGGDASMKRCTTFAKKLSEITDKQRDVLLKELRALKLTNYLTEGSRSRSCLRPH